MLAFVAVAVLSACTSSSIDSSSAVASSVATAVETGLGEPGVDGSDEENRSDPDDETSL